MEENNSPIYIIENQSEENVDQIVDINNENLSEKNNEFESSQKINKIESNKSQIKEEKKSKGFVRILRKIFKKKDDFRKKIVNNGKKEH